MSTAKKLMVEVVDAQNLAPKDGHGTSSPYVLVDFHGQRRKTRTAVRDLNPVWNETLSFNVGAHNDIFGDVLELDVYHDQKLGPTRRDNSLGRIRLSSSQFVRKGEEALIYYDLKKKSLFNMVQGKVGLKIYYVDEEVSPPPPPEKPAPPPPPPQKNEESKPEDAAEPQEKETKPSDVTEKVEEVEPPAPPSDPPPEGDKPKEEPPEKEKTEPEKPPEPESDAIPEPQPPQRPEEEGADPVDVLPPEACVMAAASISRSNSEIRFSGINGPQPIRRSASTASFTDKV